MLSTLQPRLAKPRPWLRLCSSKHSRPWRCDQLLQVVDPKLDRAGRTGSSTYVSPDRSLVSRVDVPYHEEAARVRAGEDRLPELHPAEVVAEAVHLADLGSVNRQDVQVGVVGVDLDVQDAA